MYTALLKSLAMQYDTGIVKHLGNTVIITALFSFTGGKEGESGLSWQV